MSPIPALWWAVRCRLSQTSTTSSSQACWMFFLLCFTGGCSVMDVMNFPGPSSAKKVCIPLGGHHHHQPWSRGCTTAETCCIRALYGTVIIQCCLRRSLRSPSLSHRDVGGTWEGPVDGAAPSGGRTLRSCAGEASACWVCA